jgi:PQQ-dependent catabolism-associated CXXCW motif protein
VRRAVVGALVGSLALLVFAGAVAWGGQTPPPEPAGYRMSDYRGPTPATLAGARVLTTVEAAALWKAGAAFVDVLPHAPRPADLPPGTIWRDTSRMDIPGSVWLPDTGYGALAAATERYLRDGLAQVTRDNRTRWLVFYCLKDCWMSWNAAKRALSFGYRSVAWYPDGTDGWQAAGLPLREARPAPAEPR